MKGMLDSMFALIGIQCPDLTPPDHGYAITSYRSQCSSDASVGLQCEMACDVGFEMVGDSVKYCKGREDVICATGYWSGQDESGLEDSHQEPRCEGWCFCRCFLVIIWF